MGAAEQFETIADDLDTTQAEGRGALSIAPESVVVRRNAWLLGPVGVVAGGVAVAYAARALTTGSVTDWLVAAVLALLSVLHLLGAWDARLPLFVADSHGIRMRLGRTWRGLTWGAIERVEHEPSPGLGRDGRLLVVAHNEERVLDGLSGAARRGAAWSRMFYGAPLAVPLGPVTRSSHASQDLTEALHSLAGHRAPIVTVLPVRHDVEAEQSVVEPVDYDHDADQRWIDAASPVPADAPVPDEMVDGVVEEAGEEVEQAPRWRDPRPVLAGWIARLGGRGREISQTPDEEEPHEQIAAEEADASDAVEVTSEPALPLRETTSARRTEVTRSLREPADADPDPESGARELHCPGSVSLVEEHEGWGSRVRAIARGGDSVEPLVVDEHLPQASPDPVVGPELAAARTRLGLSIDALAARTRVRAHVIEAIEVDDFDPCGGDFYARGHLRTLARVLGIDVAPLLSAYDERYAKAPINPTRVFEADLASGGSLRSMRGGPNWSVLVAAVMALVLAWSVARLMMDSPTERPITPALNGSAGVAGPASSGDAVPVLVRAAGGGARVVVRESSGKVVFTGDIAYGQTKTIEVVPPVRVETSDGSVEVVVDGAEKGAVGKRGQRATATYVVR